MFAIVACVLLTCTLAGATEIPEIIQPETQEQSPMELSVEKMGLAGPCCDHVSQCPILDNFEVECSPSLPCYEYPQIWSYTCVYIPK